MTTNVSDHLSDIGANVYGQKYLKPFLWLKKRSPFSFFLGGVHIQNNDGHSVKITINFSDIQYDIGVKGQG